MNNNIAKNLQNHFPIATYIQDKPLIDYMALKFLPKTILYIKSEPFRRIFKSK